LEGEAAKISVFDRGFLYGDGIFESLRAYRGRVFKLAEHLQRLRASAEALRLEIPAGDVELGRLLQEALARNRLQDAFLRLTITRGIGRLGLEPGACRTPSLVIMAHEFSGQPAEMYDRGVSAWIVKVRHIAPECLPSGAKHMNFLNNILAKAEASGMGAFEGLLLTQAGYLCEGTVSNLFFVHKGRLYTPSLATGALPGITRATIIELAQESGIPVEEGEYPPSNLFSADEAFLTNTSLEVMPVTSVNACPIGDGRPGEITRILREAFSRLTVQQ